MVKHHTAPLAQQHRQNQAATGMRHGRGEDKGLERRDTKVQHLHPVGMEPGAVGQHHALGASSGATGEVDAGDVLGRHIGAHPVRRVGVEQRPQAVVTRGQCAGLVRHADEVLHGLQAGAHLLDPSGQFLVVDEDLAACKVHHVDVVVIAQQHRQRHPRGAQMRQGVLAGHVFGAIDHQERHPIGKPHPQRRQRRIQPPCLITQGPVAQVLAALRDGDGIAAVLHGAVIELTNGERRHHDGRRM